MKNPLTRREVSIRFLSLLSIASFAHQVKAQDKETQMADTGGISRTCECIHQEVVIKATRDRVYQALTDAKRFSKVTDLVMPGAATSISAEAGSSFLLFGGVITGRNIELVPGERSGLAGRIDRR